MNRTFLLVVLAVIAVGAWLSRPGAAADAVDNPLVAAVSPADAMGRVHNAALADAFKRSPVAGGFEAFASKLTVQRDESGPRREVASLWHGGEKVLILTMIVGRDGSNATIDVTAQVPDSSLTRQRSLRPEDRAALATLADLAVTDYLAGLLGAPQLPPGAIGEALDAASGFGANDRAGFARRITQAVELAYPVTLAASSDADPDDAEDTGDAEAGDDWYAETSPDDAGFADLSAAPDADFGRGEDPDPATADD